jgi:hypothetical protein
MKFKLALLVTGLLQQFFTQTLQYFIAVWLVFQSQSEIGKNLLGLMSN